MDGDRVMGLGINAGVIQDLEECIALFGLFGLNDIEVIDMAIAFPLRRQGKILCALETSSVTGGPFAAQIIPGVNVLKLGAQHPRVEVVQAAIESEAVHVALVRAVIAQFADRRVDSLVVGHYRAAVAERAEVLLNDKTAGGRVA